MQETVAPNYWQSSLYTIKKDHPLSLFDVVLNALVIIVAGEKHVRWRGRQRGPAQPSRGRLSTNARPRSGQAASSGTTNHWTHSRGERGRPGSQQWPSNNNNRTASGWTHWRGARSRDRRQQNADQEGHYYRTSKCNGERAHGQQRRAQRSGHHQSSSRRSDSKKKGDTSDQNLTQTYNCTQWSIRAATKLRKLYDI